MNFKVEGPWNTTTVLSATIFDKQENVMNSRSSGMAK